MEMASASCIWALETGEEVVSLVQLADKLV
jgi:hypothetical protein